MMVAVVGGSKGLAKAFASGLQREFACHGVGSDTCATDVEGALMMRGKVSVAVLMPQVAEAAGALRGATGAQALVVSPHDFRRRNVRKVANDVLSLVGE